MLPAFATHQDSTLQAASCDARPHRSSRIESEDTESYLSQCARYQSARSRSKSALHSTDIPPIRSCATESPRRLHAVPLPRIYKSIVHSKLVYARRTNSVRLLSLADR